jgi:tartrate dehydratase alpha subunit/fumarate hydratase class I-like protein
LGILILSAALVVGITIGCVAERRLGVN